MHEIERRKKITDYIITHQGCLTEELFKAVEGYIARRNPSILIPQIIFIYQVLQSPMK
jgi:hypothetical protein